jgi:hypothetical protein
MTCQNCNKVGHIASVCENNKVSTPTFRLQTLKFPRTPTRRHHSSYSMLSSTKLRTRTTTLTCPYVRIKNTGVPLSRRRMVSTVGKSQKNGFSSIASQPLMLSQTHEVHPSLTIHAQAGKAVTKLRGTVPGYGKVWYCPNCIANILSLAHVAKTRLVTFNSTKGNQFKVTKDNGSTQIFKQSEHGLFYYDMWTSKCST